MLLYIKSLEFDGRLVGYRIGVTVKGSIFHYDIALDSIPYDMLLFLRRGVSEKVQLFVYEDALVSYEEQQGLIVNNISENARYILAVRNMVIKDEVMAQNILFLPKGILLFVKQLQGDGIWVDVVYAKSYENALSADGISLPSVARHGLYEVFVSFSTLKRWVGVGFGLAVLKAWGSPLGATENREFMEWWKRQNVRIYASVPDDGLSNIIDDCSCIIE